MDRIYKEINELLELQWDPEHIESIKNIKSNLKGYSVFLTKSLKEDIVKLLELAKKIKIENETFVAQEKI